MFQIACRVEKASTVNGEFRIRGIASDSSIDRDEEMFAPEAILKMKERVKAVKIPLRAEHKPDWFTEIGTIVDADINDQGQLIVEAVVDKEMSLGKDFIHLCKRAQKEQRTMPQFSVAGDVLDYGLLFVDTLKKHIKLYKDVQINEISLVSRPSNKNVTLEVPFVKSVDWSKFNEELHFISNDEMTVTEQVTKGILAEEIMEEAAERKLRENIWTMWSALQDIMGDDDKSKEEKESAIDEFSTMLKNEAEALSMMWGDSEDSVLRSHVLAQMENTVEKFTLPKIVDRFIKEEAPEVQPEAVEEVIEPTVEEEKKEEVVETIQKSELVSALEQVLESFVKQCVEGVVAAMKVEKNEVVEEAPLEEQDESENIVAEAGDADTASTTSEAPTAPVEAQEVSKSVVAKVENAEAFGSFTKSMNEHFAKTEAMRTEVFKSMEQFQNNFKDLAQKVEKMSQTALSRRSVASTQIVEKAAQQLQFNSEKELIEHNMTKTNNDFQKAYAAAKSGIVL